MGACTMSIALTHPDAKIRIEDLADGRRRVTVVPQKHTYIPRASCETSYPLNLIQLILDIKGPEYLCDEIARTEDPEYVRRDLETYLLAYFDRVDLTIRECSISVAVAAHRP